MARTLTVNIVGDSRSLERAFSRSSRSAKRFEGSVTGISRGISGAFAALGATVGAAGIVAGIKSSVEAASGLNEEVSKSRVIFGDSQKAIIAWSRTTADAFGISQREALAAASNFGGLFQQIGKGDQEAARMSRGFVQLAGDLASFFNIDTETALQNLRSGLAGEAEPLRRFNIFIDEATVKAEAYRSGIAKTGATLTQGQKLQARYNLITRLAGPAHGDAARTANSWANVQRRLAAIIDDTSAKLGRALLPVLQEYGNRLIDWLSNARNVQRLQKGLNDVLDAAADIFRTLKGFVQGAVDVLRPFAGLVGDASGALKTLGGIYAGMRLATVARNWKAVNVQAERASTIGTQVTGGAAAGRRRGRVTGRGLAGAAGADPTGVVLAGVIIQGVVRKVPGWNKAFGSIGGAIFDSAQKTGEATDLFESDADRIAAAVKRIEEATKFPVLRIPDESALAATKAAVTARERAAAAAGGGNGGGRRGTTAAERAARAAAAAVRIAGVDARLARQLDRLQDLGLRKQLARLRVIAQEVRERLAVTRDATRRLTLEDQLLDIMRQQRGVQEEITAGVQAANQALKERADAIKSAVIERLQRRQTDVLNRRALADAREQLRIARQIGTATGIRGARRGLQDVQFDIDRARLENAPARLTAGGRFQLGNVVININGVTDPEAVARRVDEILKKRRRRTTSQIRPTAAGNTA